MVYSLKGKIALVTGASAGIGEACARAFAALGADVIIGARRMKRLEALAGELRQSYGVRVLPLLLDVRDYPSLERAISGLPEDWNAIEVLINNAGVSIRLDKVFDADVTHWDTIIDTNIKGLLYVTRLVLPGMIARKAGHIFNIGSIAGQETYPAGNVYCASKAAVRSLSKAMRLDLSGTPIRVTLVEPGMTKTEFTLVRWSGDVEKANEMYKGVECMLPEDVADVVAFCATRPLHVDVSEVVMMPTQQASVHLVHRKKDGE